MRWHTFAAATLITSLTSFAIGQLTPDRLYYGADRAVPVQVAIPANVQGEARVDIYVAGTAAPAMTASVVAGGANFATLFPDLWGKKAPSLMMAQLVVGGKKVGAPLVMQPLLDSGPAQMDRATGMPSWAPKRNQLSGYRIYTEKNVVMTTSLGEITIRLRADQAPNTCWNFMELVKGGFYTDVIFHRILGPQGGRPGFMAQCGDPTGTGGGGPGYCIDLEDSRLPHDFGVLSMARTGDPNTNGSQFFLCFSREGTAGLDGAYCAFGQTIAGAEVIKKLEAVETKTGANGEPSAPVKPPVLISAKLVDAEPYGEQRPAVTAPVEAAPR